MATGLSRSFRGRRVLDEIEFFCPTGRVAVISGQNGAGKTTVLRIFATVLYPDFGTATVHGYDVVREGAEVRALIGVALVNERSLFWRLSGRENLRLFAAASGVPRSLRDEHIEGMLDELDLRQFADQRVANLSAGQRQRLILARAGVGHPRVLLLDEPLRGLDQPGIECVLAFIRRQTELGNTVLVVAPVLQELAEVADEIWELEAGHLHRTTLATARVVAR